MAHVVDPHAFAWLLDQLAKPSPSPFPTKPRPEPPPDFQADLVRPDDLLTLHVAGYNLKPSGQAQPALVRIDAAKEAVLVVTFPPQNIAETAYFHSANPLPPPPLPPRIPPQPDPPPGTPPAPGQTAARLAGFTRLAFRIAANAPMPAIPYSIEGLLDWSGFDPVVSALADVPPQPSAGEIAAAPAIAPPGAKETAIELPYRITLSPNHNFAWRHAMAPVTYSSRTELWHTRLVAKAGAGVTELSAFNTAPLRAIWSQDYNPARAFDKEHQGPQKTDTDPLPLGVTDISPNDRHQIVILTSAFHGYGDDNNAPFVPTPVDAQMLMLSPLGGWLRSRGHWVPPRALRFIRWPPRVFEADMAPVANGIQPAEKVAPAEIRSEAQPSADGARVAEAIPPAANVAARLGAVVDHRFDKPIVARPTIPPISPGIPIIGDRLDLSEWVHIAAQGRDHYVRIVYEGHLYPFGHRAALIKITERKFIDTAVPEGGTTPVANMIQREYIVVREPEKSYRQQLTGQAEVLAGRKLPLTKIRLTTLVTPDLFQPLDVFGLPPSTEPHTEFSFWIRTGLSTPQDFRFHAVATDISGHEIEFTTPLIFASLTDTGGNPNNLANIQKIYRGSGERRACPVPKQKMTYAPRDPAATTDNTTLATSALYFDTDLHPALTASFGGYMPILYKAAVHIPAIEQLLGTDTNTTIRLYDPYIQGNFDAHAGVFAEIVKDTGTALAPDQMPVTFTADKAGGMATPNLNMTTLSRAHGPLAGKAADAAQDAFNASEFFGGLSPDALPQLFGSIPLANLLTSGGGASAATNAPKTQISVEGNTVVVKFDWTPKVQSFSAPGGLISFTPNDPSNTLEITGIIRKPIAVPPAAPPPGSFAFDGKLRDFELEILGAIVLHFDKFTFSAGSNKKLDVNVFLKDPAFNFKGDLAFVEGLMEIIPPGTFGDGPSIDLTLAPPGVHVGYGVTLPPASVGVFSLENIKLGAGLSLPLLTGKPVVDFAFAERAHPFLLTVSLLGGGGFLHVQLDATGMKMLEAALEFGANASINLGVASGGVHIMAGIYFSMQVDDAGKTKATLQGYLRMGGELSVLGIISLSLEFVLSFTYSDGKASGRATLTVAVKVLFFSKSVEISVEKQFGGSAGDPTFAHLITSPGVWASYANAYA